MKFCPECKAMMRPKSGTLTCTRCGKTETNEEPPRILKGELQSVERVVHEGDSDTRPQHSAECPKCAHQHAFFNIVQTRSSDEPSTTFNECCDCGHRWREY